MSENKTIDALMELYLNSNWKEIKRTINYITKNYNLSLKEIDIDKIIEKKVLRELLRFLLEKLDLNQIKSVFANKFNLWKYKDYYLYWDDWMFMSNFDFVYIVDDISDDLKISFKDMQFWTTKEAQLYIDNL